MNARIPLIFIPMLFYLAICPGKPHAANGALEDTLTCYSWESNQWNAQNRTITTYTPAGLPAKILQQTGSDLKNWRQELLSYDSRGNLLLSTVQLWDTPSQSWQNQHRSLAAYDSAGQLISRISQHADPQNDSLWHNVSRLLYSWNASGQLSASLVQSWDSAASLWKDEYRTLSTYTSGLLSESLEQAWADTAMQWVNKERSLYTYNQQDSLVELLIQYWNASPPGWVGYEREQWTFGPDGLLLENQYGIWIADSGKWRRTTQDLYAYDASGNLSVLTQNRWDPLDGTFLFIYLDSMKYDIRDLMVEKVQHQYIAPAQIWLHNRKIFFTYNAQALLTGQQDWSWNLTTAAWEEFRWLQNTYDQDGNLIEWLTQFWDGSTWENGNRCVSHYLITDIAAGKDIPDITLQAFPNPFSKRLHIAVERDSPGEISLTLLSMEGRQVFHQSAGSLLPGKHLFEWDGADLAQGIYLLRVETETGSTLRKLLRVP